MSTRLGDASGRLFGDSRAPSIRNDEFARRHGIDPYDTHAFRSALLRSGPGSERVDRAASGHVNPGIVQKLKKIFGF